jgi:hypothetical protein
MNYQSSRSHHSGGSRIGWGAGEVVSRGVELPSPLGTGMNRRSVAVLTTDGANPALLALTQPRVRSQEVGDQIAKAAAEGFPVAEVELEGKLPAVSDRTTVVSRKFCK